MSLEKNKNLLKQMTFSEKQLAYPNSQRMYALLQAFREGQTIQKIHEWTQIDPWFLDQFQRLIKFEQKIKTTTKKHLTPHVLLLAKRMGVPDFLLAHWFNKKERDIRKLRWKYHIVPSFYQVDTCAGEFASQTPYYYPTYWGSSTRTKENEKRQKQSGDLR